MRTLKKLLLLLSISLFLFPSIIGVQVNTSVTAASDENWATDIASSGSIKGDQTPARSFQGNITATVIQRRQKLLQSHSVSGSASFTRHLMCKDHELYWDGHVLRYDPIDPTTIFRPSDTKAVCLTSVSIHENITFRWHYRSNSSKSWISCFNWSTQALYPGEYREYDYEGHLLIAGYWPGTNYPRAYKVDVYLDGAFSFSEFFEVTNGGLNSPRICEGFDENGHPVNMKSRFTIDVDTKAHHHLRFDKIAYFNEQLGCCHDFTTVWIQPDGNTYKTYTSSFADYKNINATWNCWKYNYTQDDYIPINSSTSVGNWKVEVYLDSYYFNNTWMRYGPVATTPFIVGSEPVPDWTFMVYLDADSNLEPAGIEIFLKMAGVGSSSLVNIVVQMDRIPGYDSRYGNWTDCKRFYVTEDMTPTLGNATLHLGEVNMGHPDTLKDFVNWTIHYYPANYYFLALWGHGTGCMGVCFDITNNLDALSLPELSQALSGLPAMMDVVFLDACSMGMTEVACQIKDYANVLVGPEGLGYTPAPYDHYFSSLTSNSSMSPSAFATEVVTEYIEWCNLQPIKDISNATMSATDLTKITSLMAAIDDFALKLKEKETPYLSLLSTSHEQIILARNLTEEYLGPYAGDTGYYIDLYHFANLTCQYVLDEELRDTADQVMTALKSIIIIEADKFRPDSHGLSISFPDKKEKYHDSFGSVYEETTFAEDTSWDEFVKYHLSGYVLTIRTPYHGIAVKVDEESYKTDADGKIRVFVLPDDYTVNVTTPISTEPGLRGVFAQWNDNETSNPRTLFVNRKLTLKAEYATKYRLIMDTNFGITDPCVGEHWQEADSTVEISATDPSTTWGEQYERYVWLGWTGTGPGSYNGTDNPAFITMSGPINETATWRHEYRLTKTSPYGSLTPEREWFEVGESINASVTSLWPPEATDTRYRCTGWSGTGSVSTSGTSTSATFTIAEPSSITWNWKTQYLLTVRTDPAGLSPQPTREPAGEAGLDGWWYDNGTPVNCTAQKISGYVFDYWTVDGESWGRGFNPINVTMYGPHEAKAYYVRAHAWWETLFRPEMLQVILGLVGIVLTVAFVGTAWVRTRRRRGVVKALLDEIDEVYSRLKTDPQKCGEELSRLRHTILEGFTDGKISEESYNVLDKRIDEYMEELQK